MKSIPTVFLLVMTLPLIGCMERTRELESELKYRQADIQQLSEEIELLKADIVEKEQKIQFLEDSKKTEDHMFIVMSESNLIDYKSMIYLKNPKRLNFTLHIIHNDGNKTFMNHTVNCENMTYYINNITSTTSININGSNLPSKDNPTDVVKGSAPEFMGNMYCDF